MIDNKNLLAATKSYVESLHPEHKNIEIAGVYVEMEHYPTSGCSCRDDECDITNTLDIWFTRDRNVGDKPYFLPDGTAARKEDLHSVDAESIHFTEYITFLANWHGGLAHWNPGA